MHRSARDDLSAGGNGADDRNVPFRKDDRLSGPYGLVDDQRLQGGARRLQNSCLRLWLGIAGIRNGGLNSRRNRLNGGDIHITGRTSTLQDRRHAGRNHRMARAFNAHDADIALRQMREKLSELLPIDL